MRVKLYQSIHSCSSASTASCADCITPSGLSVDYRNKENVLPLLIPCGNPIL